MAAKREEMSAVQIERLKYLPQLLPMLERLHDVGCRRDRAGNRRLHCDQYCLLVLLFLFNPVVRSLRGLQQAIYGHRWAIELFFRFFKHVLGCRHLLSTDPVGIQSKPTERSLPACWCICGRAGGRLYGPAKWSAFISWAGPIWRN